MQQQSRRPVEYITMTKSVSGNKNVTCDEIFNQSHLSHLKVEDDMDDDNSASYCLHPPSLTSTYDDENDSQSFDLIADMISNDEISIDMSNNCEPHRDSSGMSMDHTTFEQSHIPAHSQPLKRHEYLCNGVSQYSGSYERPSTPSISTLSFRSQRIDELRNRRRSIELTYRELKSNISIPCDLTCKDSERFADSNKTSIPSHSYVHLSANTLEASADIICISIVMCLIYTISALYNDAISEIM